MARHRPVEIRPRHTIAPSGVTDTGVNDFTYKSGSYHETLELCPEETRKAGRWELRDTDDGVRHGIPKIRMAPGFEVTHVRMDGSGDVVVTTWCRRSQRSCRSRCTTSKNRVATSRRARRAWGSTIGAPAELMRLIETPGPATTTQEDK